MPCICLEDLISAERGALFRLADNYKHRLQWDSFSTRVRYDHGAVTSLTGLMAPAGIYNPLRMRVEHFQLLPPAMVGSSMLQGPVFFSRLTTSSRFEAMEENLTKVVLEIHFESRWPWLKWVVDPLLTKMLAPRWAAGINGFKVCRREDRSSQLS